jgi:hypothetical protein
MKEDPTISRYKIKSKRTHQAKVDRKQWVVGCELLLAAFQLVHQNLSSFDVMSAAVSESLKACAERPSRHLVVLVNVHNQQSIRGMDGF